VHPKREVEIVTLRLRAVVKSPKMEAMKGHAGKMNHVGTGAFARPGRATLGRPSQPKVPVAFEGKKLETKLYSRDELQPGKEYSGPAIVTEYSATTVIPPDVRFQLDRASNLIVNIR
jgi:N-methylhydantoinase A